MNKSFGLLFLMWLGILITIIQTQKDSELFFYTLYTLFAGGLLFLVIMPISYLVRRNKYGESASEVPTIVWWLLLLLFLVIFVIFPVLN